MRMLFVCVPHAAETEGLINTKELALLPDKAVIVNVGSSSALGFWV